MCVLFPSPGQLNSAEEFFLLLSAVKYENTLILSPQRQKYV